MLGQFRYPFRALILPGCLVRVNPMASGAMRSCGAVSQEVAARGHSASPSRPAPASLRRLRAAGLPGCGGGDFYGGPRQTLVLRNRSIRGPAILRN
jgi:hypothetical protein